MGLPVFKLGLIGAIDTSSMSIVNSLRHQPRLLITEVFDTCLMQGQANAQQHEASFSPSLENLLCRSQAVVVGDVNWMRVEPILRAAERQRPVLILMKALSSFNRNELLKLRQVADATRVLIMPELAHRWARSTLRLRELTATQLGAIEHLEVYSQEKATEHGSLMVYDWCINVIQSECRSVKFDLNTGEAVLKFRRLSRDGHPVMAVVKFAPTENSAQFPVTEARINCRHGMVHLSGEQTVEWQIERRSTTESLTSDRSASDVMCDLFGRRLAGGLVPIPEIADVIRAGAIRNACLSSFESGDEVVIQSSIDT